MHRFLFHPRVTLTLVIAALSSVLGFSFQIQQTWGTKGLLVCLLLSALVAMAGAGRSYLPPVDAGPGDPAGPPRHPGAEEGPW